MKYIILVIEQNPAINHFVCESLKQNNYETMQANNGADALEVIKYNTDKINLILVNYPVSDMTGIEFLIKASDVFAFKIPPILFMATELNEETLKTARESGMKDWIKKPYRAQTFFNQIRDALGS